MTPVDRRAAICRLLFGAGAIGLRSLVTGVPASILLAAEQGRAASPRGLAAASARAPQYVLFSTSGLGDPINANAPGTYEDANIAHSSDPRMAATPIALGSVRSKAAQLWATLPQTTLAQTNFFHHATYTQVHPDITSCLKLQGASKGGEMLPSIMAQELGAKLQTTMTDPVNFSYEFVSSKGALQQNLSPQSLASTLSPPGGGLGDARLVALRDKSLDLLHAWAKSRGQDYQKLYVDRYALSQTQVRTMQQQLVSQLSKLNGDSIESRVAAALLLFKLNVAPVVVVNLPFGSDNHYDPNFASNEVPQHASSIALLARFQQDAADAGLQGKVTLCTHNVFGRQLSLNATGGRAGRGHCDTHAVSVLMGSNVQGGVTGGVQSSATNKDAYVAQGIDSVSGNASQAGDIPYADTFGSLGKTMLAAVGVDDEVIDKKIQQGKTVVSALAN